MIYNLSIQKDGEAAAEPIQLTMRDPYVIQQNIADYCSGYRLSEKEYKRLIKGQSLILKGLDSQYEVALT